MEKKFITIGCLILNISIVQYPTHLHQYVRMHVRMCIAVR